MRTEIYNRFCDFGVVISIKIELMKRRRFVDAMFAGNEFLIFLHQNALKIIDSNFAAILETYSM